MSSNRPQQVDHLLPMQPATFVLIIGAMKSGTSTLYEALAQHPQVCRCMTKEPEFFSKHQNYGVEAEKYASLWPDFDPEIHIRCLEASTGYTKFPQEEGIPQRIRGYGLNPRFIYIVRNPFDRITSHLNFHRTRYGILDDDFTEPQFVDLSRYGAQIEQYLNVFPDKDQYWTVDFDDLVQNQSGVAREGYHFLGVDASFTVQRKRANQTRDISTLEFSLQQIGFRRLARAVFPESIRKPVRTLMRQLLPSVKLSMTPNQRSDIHSMFYNDMLRFQRLTGFDVGKWGF